MIKSKKSDLIIKTKVGTFKVEENNELSYNRSKETKDKNEEKDF